MSTAISRNLQRLLSEMIKVNSVAPPGNEKALACFIASMLREKGLEPVIQDLGNNRANLFCEIGSGVERRLILNGHLDTVPAEGEWKHDPFEGKTSGIYLYGRGACDMKAGLACMLQAFIDTAKEERDLKGRLKLLFVADEETSNLGLRGYLSDYNDMDRSSARHNYAIIGEPTDLYVCNSHYGVERYWISIHGLGAHSSNPELGINAIAGAASVVESINRYHKELRTRITESGSPSCAVTIIEGGEKQNSIPTNARVFIDRRTVPGERPVDVYQEIKTWIDAETDLKGCKATVEPYFSLNSGLLQRDNNFLAEILNENGQDEPNVFPAGCEQGILLSAGYDAAVLGPGSIRDAHMPDEKVRVSDLFKAYDVYRKIISRVLMPDRRNSRSFSQAENPIDIQQ